MALMTEIIGLLTAGIVEFGAAVGTALSNLATSVFLTGTGEAQTLSIFGTLVVIFAGISLAFGLCRWVLNFVTSLGSKNN